MNVLKSNTTNYYNHGMVGPSGPQANYALVYDKIDNIPGQEVNSLLDASILRDIKNLLITNISKKQSGNDQVNLNSNLWTKLNDHEASKISIFNDTDETIEIKQTEVPCLKNYDHSTTFKLDLTSSVGSGVNVNYPGWGDFRTVFNIDFQISNYPIVSRNTYSYLKLPIDYETKEWELSFDIKTDAPQGWSGWHPNWGLGGGYFVNAFNSWENKPSPIGLLPYSLSTFDVGGSTRTPSNTSNGELGPNGYTLFISDPKVRSSEIANALYPNFGITGAYFSGGGTITSSGTYNLVLMTSGLDTNNSNLNVRLGISPPGYWFYQTGLLKENIQTISVRQANLLGQTNPVNQYVDLLLEVEREFPDGLGGKTKEYIPREWGRLYKNGSNPIAWSNFFPIGRYPRENYWNYSPELGDINSLQGAKSRTISLYYGENLLKTTSISLDNYYNYNEKTKVVFAQKGGNFGVYLQNKSNNYDLVLEYYDRYYYAKSKVGKFLGFGSVIRSGAYAYHNISNAYLNNKKLDLNSQQSITDYFLSSSIPSIKIYPNTAIDMQISNTNQIFIYNSGSSAKNIKYRWEN